MDSWWEIPSLDNYLAQLVQKLWGGNIVLVFLPEIIPLDFFSEFKEKCKRCNITEFAVIDFNGDESLNPAKVLHDYFELGEAETFVPKNIGAIFDNIKKSSQRLIVLQNFSKVNQKEFLSFMDDLFHYNKNVELTNRDKILVIIDNGSYKPSDFKPEPFVQKEIFSQVIDELTQLNSLRYYIKYKHESLGHLYESIIISLAIFDSWITERLVECSSLLDDYEKVLKEYAHEKKWQSISFKSKDTFSEKEKWDGWAKGILDFENNDIVYHSAYLQINSFEKEVKKRIWKSCSRNIIPLIEDIRNKLVISNKTEFTRGAYLINPKELKKDKDEFEIGDIAYCVNTKLINIKCADNSKRKRIIDLINLCKDIRNEVSHLKIPERNKIESFYKELKYIDDILN